MRLVGNSLFIEYNFRLSTVGAESVREYYGSSFNMTVCKCNVRSILNDTHTQLSNNKTDCVLAWDKLTRALCWQQAQTGCCIDHGRSQE